MSSATAPTSAYSTSSIHRESTTLLEQPALLLIGAHLVIAILVYYSLAFATHFTFRFAHIAFMDHYRYLANGFAHFHLYGCDAQGKPLPTGCVDCLNYYGKVYYPYGPVPAFIQLVLVNLLGFPAKSGKIVWGLCAITLYAAFWIARWYARNILKLTPSASVMAACAFVTVAGTTDIFLHTSTVPYSWSQACAAGQLLNLLSAFLLIRALHTGQARGILWSGILCGLSFLSKQNYLPGFLAGCALLLWSAWRGRWPRRLLMERLASFLLPVVICGATLLWYNYARFGSPFDTGFPYLNASEKAPEPYQMPQPHRIPYNFYNQFLAGFEIRTSDFPFVLGKSSSFGVINRKDGSGGLLHNFPIFSVFVSMPMLLLLIPAFLYAVVLLLRKRLPEGWQYGLYLVALWLCVFAYFLNESGTFMRYQYDMPFLLGLCVMQVVILGWRAMARISQRALSTALRACFAIFLLLCFVEQAALGLDQTAGLILSQTDKFLYWDAAAGRASDGHLRQRAHAIRSILFDRTTAANSSETLTITSSAQPVPPVGPKGFHWFIRNSNLLYESDGTRWNLLSSPQSLYFSLVFPLHAPVNGTEPLIQFGKPPGADALNVTYLPGELISFQYAHSLTSRCSSAGYPYQPEKPYGLSVEPDQLFQRFRVRFAGQTVLDCGIGVYGYEPNSRLGVNAIGLKGVGPSFSGHIDRIGSNTPQSPDAQRFKLEATLPDHPAHSSEPLLQLGNRALNADLLGVQYQPDGRIRLFFDHWGTPPCVSEPFPVLPGHPQLIETVLDPISGQTTVKLNGATAIDCASGMFREALTTHTLGKNTLGFTTADPAFSGSVQDMTALRTAAKLHSRQ
ncbi:MAG: hypothetical protein JO182_11630 [Acidobacteriaceae bacterium]|nr:hypothetical protein [Acidobacteriaceae bacterium]